MNPPKSGSCAGPLAGWPLVDLSPLHENPRNRPALVETIRAIGREYGFFYAYQHGIADCLVERIWGEAARFFQLPHAQKMALHAAHNDPIRGYSPAPQGPSSPSADLMESFEMALELPMDDPDRQRGARLYGPNPWPVVLPGFQSLLYDKYYLQALSLSRKLAGLVAQALHLPPDYFDNKTSKPLCTLRILHYPPTPPSHQPQHSGPANPHTIREMFAILARDAADNLEVQRRDGTWIEAPHIPGTLTVSFGTLLERWSNHHIHAAPHRTLHTPAQEHYGLPFTFAPDYFCPIQCLPSCHSPKKPTQYPTILAGHYLASLQKTPTPH